MISKISSIRNTWKVSVDALWPNRHRLLTLIVLVFTIEMLHKIRSVGCLGFFISVHTYRQTSKMHEHTASLVPRLYFQKMFSFVTQTYTRKGDEASIVQLLEACILFGYTLT